MGMYDVLNGYQIKCFSSPYYMGAEDADKLFSGLGYTSGYLMSFQTGDKLPLSSLSYKYAKNLIILDCLMRGGEKKCPVCEDVRVTEDVYCPECQAEFFDFVAVVHIIRDGKLTNTIDDIYHVMNQQEFDDIEEVVDYYGNQLNITSYEEMLQYISDYQQYMIEMKEVNRLTHPSFNAMTKAQRNQVSGDELKEIEEEFERMNEVYTKKVEELHLKYIWKWRTANKYAAEETLGAYFDCLISKIKSTSSEETLTEKDQKLVQDLVKETAQFMVNNQGIYDSFMDWVEVSDDTKEWIELIYEKFFLKMI